MESKREAIQSVEDRLLDFFHHSPGAFRKNLVLQMAGQVGAVLEVYLILRLMGHSVGFSSALAIEGLTKLVNVIGMINPGNAGTYEGGNMLFAKLVGLTGTAGLTLALIRRVRALFWAAVGAICAVMLPGSARRENRKVQHDADRAEHGHTAIILAQRNPRPIPFWRAWARSRCCCARFWERKRRARGGSSWSSTAGCGAAVPRRAAAYADGFPTMSSGTRRRRAKSRQSLRDIADGEERIVLIAADRTYHPSLHRRAAEWDGAKVLALTTDDQPAGMYAFTTPSGNRSAQAMSRGNRGRSTELHDWLTAAEGIVCESVPSDQWQRVSSPEDRLLAEQKLDQWLFKPTDGVFARMNRKVSIPISRQLIKFPITPNMVSLFTLGVSFLAGAFFALGGRGNMLFGAILSVFASILDGCDGEVARLTFQDSAFGCWLETVCDYLYYVFIFAGMMIGLLGRGPVYWTWGALLFVGAVASFLTTAMQRRRMAGDRPEQYLSLWQAQASRRRSNPFLYLGRHTEFLIKRCCMPYLVLAFALFGATYMAFIGAAVGANIVWPIVLYSYFTFNPARTPHD